MSKEILQWGLALLVFVGGLYIWSWLRRRWERSRFRKEIDQLLPQLQAGNYELAHEVTKRRSLESDLARVHRLRLDTKYRAQHIEMWAQIHRLEDYCTHREPLNLLYRNFRTAEEDLNKPMCIETLYELIRVLDTKGSAYTRERLGNEWGFDTSQENLKERLAQLVFYQKENFLDGISDEASLKAYFNFISSWELVVSGLNWPEDWQKLVLEHVPLPSLELLRMENEPTPDETDLLYMTAVAIRKKDVDTAKIALAIICDEPLQWNLIGESLIAQLALLIATDDIAQPKM